MQLNSKLIFISKANSISSDDCTVCKAILKSFITHLKTLELHISCFRISFSSITLFKRKTRVWKQNRIFSLPLVSVLLCSETFQPALPHHVQGNSASCSKACSQDSCSTVKRRSSDIIKLMNEGIKCMRKLLIRLLKVFLFRFQLKVAMRDEQRKGEADVCEMCLWQEFLKRCNDMFMS